jgi:hypothetical protein
MLNWSDNIIKEKTLKNKKNFLFKRLFNFIFIAKIVDVAKEGKIETKKWKY